MVRVLAGTFIAALACLVLLLPAWFNGAPIYWYDSLAHLHGGSSALNATFGMDTRYSDMERAARVGSEPQQLQAPAAGPPATEVDKGGDAGNATARSGAVESGAEDAETDYRISMARSPYYSVIIVLLSDTFGPFAPIVAQVLLLVAAGFFLLRAVFPDQKIAPALYLLGATSLSTAGVFCAALLPDILAPVGILSVAVLFCFYDRLGWPDKAFWFSALVLAVISHTTHIAITALLVPIGVALALGRGGGRVFAPALLCLSALVIGFLSLQVFSRTVEAVYGYKPRPFPMIAASVIVDGPGLDYLKATCPGNGYVYCDYLYTEARNIDEFLWSADRRKGVFHFETPEIRNQMSDQQFAFLVDVLKYDFGGQLQASLKRFLLQMKRNSLDHLTYDQRLGYALFDRLPDSDRALVIESAAYVRQFPFAGLSNLSQFASLFALAGMVFILARMATGNGSASAAAPTPSAAAMMSFVVLVICGIVINAGITGVLSNPQGRYGARVLWLLLVTFAIVFAWYRCRSAPTVPVGRAEERA